MVKRLLNTFNNIGRNFKNKKEQRKRQKEQERREEIERLREKQEENEIFIEDFRRGLEDIKKTFNDTEEKEKQYRKSIEELEENLKQIDILSSKKSMFIFKILNDLKIKKLSDQCSKQKQAIEEIEKIITNRKEEIKKAIYELLDSLK
jgi:uncharacterized phage infection (PIP) family protein YhgE